MQNGMTLPELALAMALVGLLATIGIPKYQETLDRIAVDRSAYTLVVAHHRARITAILKSRPSLLRFTPDSVVIRVRRGTGTVPHWRGPGPAARGVEPHGRSHGIRQWHVGSPEGAGHSQGDYFAVGPSTHRSLSSAVTRRVFHEAWRRGGGSMS